jgi:hypothetical protein
MVCVARERKIVRIKDQDAIRRNEDAVVQTAEEREAEGQLVHKAVVIKSFQTEFAQLAARMRSVPLELGHLRTIRATKKGHGIEVP